MKWTPGQSRRISSSHRSTSLCRAWCWRAFMWVHSWWKRSCDTVQFASKAGLLIGCVAVGLTRRPTPGQKLAMWCFELQFMGFCTMVAKLCINLAAYTEHVQWQLSAESKMGHSAPQCSWSELVFGFALEFILTLITTRMQGSSDVHSIQSRGPFKGTGPWFMNHGS